MGIFDSIGKIAKGAVHGIEDAGKAVTNKRTWNKIGHGLEDAGKAVSSKKTWNKIGHGLEDTGKAVTNKRTWNKIGHGLEDAGKATAKVVVPVANKVAPIVEDVGGKAIKFVEPIANKTLEVTGRVIEAPLNITNDGLRSGEKLVTGTFDFLSGIPELFKNGLFMVAALVVLYVIFTLVKGNQSNYMAPNYYPGYGQPTYNPGGYLPQPPPQPPQPSFNPSIYNPRAM